MALNAGYFSNQRYDKNTTINDIKQSVNPYTYVSDINSRNNSNQKTFLYGGRPSFQSGVSNMVGNAPATSQQNVDIDSIMSNRNVPLSRSREAKVNHVNLSSIKLKDLQVGTDYIDYRHTRMTDPAMFVRGCPINRFYTLNKNPQENIYYDWGVNTKLDAKDNFNAELPNLSMIGKDTVPTKPRDRKHEWKPQVYEINPNGNCGNNGKGCTRRQ